MKVVVTGVTGQLGFDVVRELKNKKHAAFGTNSSMLDITDETAVRTYIAKVKPEAIIHCAAFTNVDQAEEREGLAYKVNALGTEHLAKAAALVGSKMLYVSTDYVFDGSSTDPYVETNPTSPLGAYGRTKLAGEEFLQKHLKNFFIVRTAWVYGINGNNFVKTMLRLGAEHGEVGVVHDQVGSPTYTVDLAKFLVELTETNQYGIYHATNDGSCSWYEFAVEIFRQAGISVKAKSLTTEQFPRLANRPKYSVLSKKRMDERGFTPLRDWKEALSAYMEELNRKELEEARE